MTDILVTAPSVLTREFWRRFSAPTAESLGRSIMSLLVIAESIVCIFWIFAANMSNWSAITNFYRRLFLTIESIPPLALLNSLEIMNKIL